MSSRSIVRRARSRSSRSLLNELRYNVTPRIVPVRGNVTVNSIPDLRHGRDIQQRKEYPRGRDCPGGFPVRVEPRKNAPIGCDHVNVRQTFSLIKLRETRVNGPPMVQHVNELDAMQYI